MSVIGSGLITTLGLGTSLATWVGYFFIAAAGTGMSNNHAYTAAQAVLSEADIPIGNGLFSNLKCLLACAKIVYSYFAVYVPARRVP